ncbi:class IV lanthionine synthetase LanL [Streptomyces roseoverticillatus]|uniref:class IV lanthionine synthetase LanL n=1 Tax=Streptomyces roseoverticillatus TaxID=66429 RepID=UPI0006950428|nr:class IV lanthionine synthetase LanL [Streptomyces roseoverticillatus]
MSTVVTTLEAATAGGSGPAWRVSVGDVWATALPPLHVPRAQGWKIHVSAASPAAAEVLRRVAGVARGARCAFKFAAGPEQLTSVNSRDCDRGSAGKFITLYPAADDGFPALAEALHAATAGLPGPAVLSDRPYRPGSRVHYRYGAFTGRPELSPDGLYRTMLTAPGGQRVEDVRGPCFSPPPWAVDPLGPERAAGAGQAGRGAGSGQATGSGRGAGPGPSALLAGRYALTGALRRSARGGVYTGTDTATGAEVVVKQALAHIEVDGSGREACTALRHEADMLARLGPPRLSPQPRELVERDGQVFLVREKVPGTTLSQWVTGHASAGAGPGVPWPVAAPLAEALLELVGAVHGLGLVVGDLAPGNVIVRPGGGLRLIDLELAAGPGEAVGRAGTPGYRAPGAGTAADPRDDLFALGGLLFLLATGQNPPPPDGAGGVPQEWLRLAAREGETARRLTPLINGLRKRAPEDRMPLPRAGALLRAGAPREAGQSSERRPGRGSDEALPGRALPDDSLSDRALPDDPLPDHALSDVLLDRLLADGVSHLAATARPRSPERMWPTTPSGRRTDPCNVQHGAAGVLGFLVRAAATRALPKDVRASARTTARAAADWIVRRTAADPAGLPGLYFGRAGTAWALHDAAGLLADDGLAARAGGLARGLPVRWPQPDVCHGAAGAGFMHLRLATGRAGACARGLLDAARRTSHGPVWPVPEDFDSAFAGGTHLGYAHGVAGVGAFLLAAAEATGEEAFLRTAVRAGGTLAATAREEGGAAWWPRRTDAPASSARSAHWCGGSSGVGTFLVRLWRATGDARALGLALAAGETVLRSRWHGTTAACHGLAGDGEFLLDLARATGAPRFRDGARTLAALLAARSTVTPGGLLVTLDETGRGCAAAYGTGTAGALAFLLRLRHGGPRLWTDL